MFHCVFNKADVKCLLKRLLKAWISNTIDWEYSSNLSLMSISSYVEYETGNINDVMNIQPLLVFSQVNFFQPCHFVMSWCVWLGHQWATPTPQKLLWPLFLLLLCHREILKFIYFLAITKVHYIHEQIVIHCEKVLCYLLFTHLKCGS